MIVQFGHNKQNQGEGRNRTGRAIRTETYHLQDNGAQKNPSQLTGRTLRPLTKKRRKPGLCKKAGKSLRGVKGRAPWRRRQYSAKKKDRKACEKIFETKKHKKKTTTTQKKKPTPQKKQKPKTPKNKPTKTTDQKQPHKTTPKTKNTTKKREKTQQKQNKHKKKKTHQPTTNAISKHLKPQSRKEEGRDPIKKAGERTKYISREGHDQITWKEKAIEGVDRYTKKSFTGRNKNENAPKV